MTRTHYVAKSGNSKTGVVAATYRERDSCPGTCPLLAKGCYAAGRIEGIARKYGGGGQEWAVRAATETPYGSVFRHLVVGDLLTATGELDTDFCGGIEYLVVTRPDITVHIAYTHAWAMPTVEAWIRRMFEQYGVVINASCQTEAEVRAASAAGLHPVTVASGADDPLLGTVLDGRRVVVCPAQTHGRTCAECKLCAKGDHDGWLRPVVAFLPHGGGARAAAATAVR